MTVAFTLHLLASTVWVGGMFFAWMALRPVALQLLDPPQRLELWMGVFDRFFPWVWVSILILPATGFWMIFSVFGGMAAVGIHVHTMLLVGLVMIVIFLWIWFVPRAGLRRAVDAKDWAAGGKHLGRIRRLIGINLILGMAVVGFAAAGRWF